MKFFNQTRLADAWLADDQHELPLALPRPPQRRISIAISSSRPTKGVS
jgi:hypothetical protein